MTAILGEVPTADLKEGGCVVQWYGIGKALGCISVGACFVYEAHIASFVIESGFDVCFSRATDFGDAAIEDASFLGLEKGLPFEENRKKRFCQTQRSDIGFHEEQGVVSFGRLDGDCESCGFAQQAPLTSELEFFSGFESTCGFSGVGNVSFGPNDFLRLSGPVVVSYF